MRYRYFAFALLAALGAGCSTLTTEAPDDRDVFDAPFEGLTFEERRAFVQGDAEFGRRFSAATGLGPVFNNVSCASCHSGDGRGRPENALFRIGTDADGFLQSLGGPQIQTQAIMGARAERVPDGVSVSVRLPPPVFGVGLIEAIPEQTILALADPNDVDGDGISGRPNMVLVHDYVSSGELQLGTGRRLGRFGRKAQTATLLEQTVEAYHQDMGITTEFRPIDNPNHQQPLSAQTNDALADPEIPTATVRSVVHYLRALAPPAPAPETTERLAGKAQFSAIGCAQCHTPSLSTGPSPIPALNNRSAVLYSDLLLHDMGPELADGRPDGEASGTEWRTAPLWGLRLTRRFLNEDAFYMHDGRATTIEQAITLHGGEGAASRSRFQALAADAKRALIAFVEGL